MAFLLSFVVQPITSSSGLVRTLLLILPTWQFVFNFPKRLSIVRPKKKPAVIIERSYIYIYISALRWQEMMIKADHIDGGGWGGVPLPRVVGGDIDRCWVVWAVLCVGWSSRFRTLPVQDSRPLTRSYQPTLILNHHTVLCEENENSLSSFWRHIDAQQEQTMNITSVGG